jgi:hypothetical protein
MLADRYVKGVLTVIAVALLAIAAHLWQGQLRPAAVDAQTAAKYGVSVPKAWGKLVGESSDGLLRIVDVEGREPEYPKVKVQVRWK